MNKKKAEYDHLPVFFRFLPINNPCPFVFCIFCNNRPVPKREIYIRRMTTQFAAKRVLWVFG